MLFAAKTRRSCYQIVSQELRLSYIKWNCEWSTHIRLCFSFYFVPTESNEWFSLCHEFDFLSRCLFFVSVWKLDNITTQQYPKWGQEPLELLLVFVSLFLAVRLTSYRPCRHNKRLHAVHWWTCEINCEGGMQCNGAMQRKGDKPSKNDNSMSKKFYTTLIKHWKMLQCTANIIMIRIK